MLPWFPWLVLFWWRYDTLCTPGFMADVIFAHMQGCQTASVTLKQPASQPDGAARRLGLTGPWVVAEAASSKPINLWSRLLQTRGWSMRSVTALLETVSNNKTRMRAIAALPYRMPKSVGARGHLGHYGYRSSTSTIAFDWPGMSDFLLVLYGDFRLGGTIVELPA